MHLPLAHRCATLAGRVVVALLCAAPLARPAHAQRADSTARRDSSARRDSTVRLHTVEVRASILSAAGPTVGTNTAARAAIIDARTANALHPRTLPEALAAQPGISTYDDLGGPRKLNLSSRGFNAGPTVGLPAGVSVFLDGIRQNEPDAQEVNFDLLPLDLVSRIEVLSGTASLLGPNSLGGAVNLVTRRAAGAPSADLTVSGGSFDSRAVEGSAQGSLPGAWNAFAGAAYDHERGWRQGTSATTRSALLNVGHSTGARSVTAQLLGASSRAATAGSLPESIFDVDPQANFTTGDLDVLSLTQASASGLTPLGPGRASATAYARHATAQRFNVNQPPDADVRSFTNNTTFGLGADWRWSTNPDASGTVRHARGEHATLALRLGVDASASDVRVRIYAEPRSDAAPPPPTSTGDEPPTAGLTTDVRSPRRELAGYTIADLATGPLTFSAGARYDLVTVPFQNQVDAGDRSANRFTRLSPRASIAIDLGGGSSAYASIGQSFRAPAILELGCADPAASCPLPFALGDDPPLAPVRATTTELGARWLAGPALLSATAYHSDVRDEIFFVASDQALLSGYFTNLPRTRRDGLELSAQTAIGPAIDAYAGYALTLATFRSATELFSTRADDQFASSPLAGPNDVAVGSHLPLTPTNQLKAGATARLPHDFELGAAWRYVGRQWLRGDEANETTPLPGYSLADARLTRRLGPWDLTAAVTNLLDTHHASFGTFNENRRTGDLERFLTPLDARTLTLSIRRAFGSPRAGDP